MMPQDLKQHHNEESTKKEHSEESKKKEHNEESKKKERHIVTWTQEEDDILREQIGIHGTENWAIIASKFKDKTTRQCRRRWYTYLNSDFKKGGWSAEEDMLLCEAQKIFGNRWTEIAKVVSGRTDNAVKNRFSTLCRKKEKYAALAKENSTSYINSNNKRIMFQQYNNVDTTAESGVPIKKMRRAHIPDDAEKSKFGDRSHLRNGTPINQQQRAPLAVLAENSHNSNNLPDQRHDCNPKFNSAQDDQIQGTFLKRDDPKRSVLIEQAELLSSLALKVDTENVDQRLEHTWKILQEFLNRNKESDIPCHKIPDLQLVDKDIKDLKSGNEEGQACWRQVEKYEDSPGSSGYSTESTFLGQSAGDNSEHTLHQDIGTEMKSEQVGDEKGVGRDDKGVLCTANVDQEILPYCEEQINSDGIVSTSSRLEFSSPIQVTPLFRSLAAGIPSPQFSESERNFLRKTLGVESPSINPSADSSQPPPCKRALLPSL
ncbi:transcription factor MYB124-like [Vigna unguiculata]|uniref:Myb proto-oncogene protein n=1 Tax=Vigna unguiculata TaxID=3917 RepID=A0A4D6L1Q5_VIGUN|nr:transcription factor MYB124-like [Vigna unguiculata]QCD82447.1 myb proto-oncogene protein [Vigna unguiculata]